MEKKHIRNKLTTDKQLVDMAASLWCAAEEVRKTLIRSNVAAYFREVNMRLVIRMEKQATTLGKYLSEPNSRAFESYQSTKVYAERYNVGM